MIADTKTRANLPESRLILLLLIFLAAPQPSRATLEDPQVGIFSYSHENEEGYAVYSRSNLYETFDVRALGVIDFTPDGKGVARMAPGAYLSIRQRRGLKTRKVVFEPDESGNVRLNYFENRSLEELGAADRDWVREMLLITYHETTIGAVIRVRRVYASGGGEAVLAALYRMTGVKTELISTDSIPKTVFPAVKAAPNVSRSEQRIFLEFLLRQDISLEVAARAVELSGEIISGSSRLADMLVSTAERFPGTAEFSRALFAAAGTISSSSERRRALVALADITPLDDSAGVALAHSITGISSSSEKRAAITAVMPRVAPYDEAFEELLLAVASISSSSEKRAAITAVSGLEDVTVAAYSGLAKVAGTISSSSEKRRAQQAERTNPFVKAYLKSASSIESSSEKRRALEALVYGGELSDAQLAELLIPARTISSSSELAGLLSTVAAARNMAAQSLTAYLETVKGISSSSEQRRAFDALLDHQELSPELVHRAIEVTRSISSGSDREWVMNRLVSKL